MTTTLFRPVGEAELQLIRDSGMSKFPPRLGIQPIFYPVKTFDYARKIAQGWNTKDKASGNAGYITEFDVDTEFLIKYPWQIAGGKDCQELWVPAEELEEFNQHIIGEIRVVAEYRGELA